MNLRDKGSIEYIVRHKMCQGRRSMLSQTLKKRSPEPSHGMKQEKGEKMRGFSPDQKQDIRAVIKSFQYNAPPVH